MGLGFLSALFNNKPNETMKTYRTALRLFVALLAVVSLARCGGPAEPVATIEQVDLDLTIVLDLSDRISNRKHPHRASKDIEIIRETLDVFAAEVQRKLFIGSNDRIRVVLAPQTSNPDAYPWLDHLTIDVRPLPLHERRDRLPVLQENFRTTLDILYSEASRSERFVGADIWQFFADTDDFKVDTLSVAGRRRRFVVLVLGDGYQINEDNLRQQSNRYTYNSNSNMRAYRNRADWERLIDGHDFGFIPAKKDLRHVEVLMMGIDPSPVALNEYNIIKKLWTKWFVEMGVQRFEIHKTNESSKAEREIVRRFLTGR